MKQQWPKRDPINGRMLCENCYNCMHHIKEAITGRKISNCNAGGCECICLELNAEVVPKKTKFRRMPSHEALEGMCKAFGAIEIK